MDISAMDAAVITTTLPDLSSAEKSDATSLGKCALPIECDCEDQTDLQKAIQRCKNINGEYVEVFECQQNICACGGVTVIHVIPPDGGTAVINCLGLMLHTALLQKAIDFCCQK